MINIDFVNVVIISHNRVSSLINTLESVSHAVQKYGTGAIHVVDNSLSDEIGASIQYVCRLISHKEGVDIHYTASPSKSKSVSLNLAVGSLTGKWVLFTDDDVVVKPSWISDMVGAAKSWSCQIVGGGVRLAANRQVAGLQRTHYECLACTDVTPWDSTFPAIGANCLYSSEIFRSGLRYREEISYGTILSLPCEDLCMWLDARTKGFLSVACYDLEVIHYPAVDRLTQTAFRDGAFVRGKYEAYIDAVVWRKHPGKQILRSFATLMTVVTTNLFKSLRSNTENVPSAYAMKLYECLGYLSFSIRYFPTFTSSVNRK